MKAATPIDRLLVTGYSVAQLQRHIEFALELGVEVLQVGEEPVFGDTRPVNYSFAAIPAGTDQFVASIRPVNPEEGQSDESVLLRDLVTEFRPDVIHAVGMDFMADACLSARLHPLVVSAHGFLEYTVYGKDTRLSARDTALLSHATTLLIEPPMQADLCRRLAPRSLSVHEFCTGVHGKVFRPAEPRERLSWRRALRLPADAMVILSSRGWGPSYRHDTVLEAFAEALPKLPKPSYLLFMKMERSAVENSMLAPQARIEARTEELGLVENVRWLPAVMPLSMAMFYNVADVVVSYRIPDTFPSTVLEALACARPVIVPRLATFADSVIEQQCTLVEPGDVTALADALVQQAANPTTTERLLAGRASVLERYDAPVVRDRIAAIYAMARHSRLVV